DVTGQITATGVSGFTIDNTRVDNAAGDAIIISNAASATLENVSLESTAGRGLWLISSSADISNLTVTTASTDGIDILVAGTDRTIALENVSIANASGFGIDVNLNGIGALDLTLSGTSSISSVGNAIDV